MALGHVFGLEGPDPGEIMTHRHVSAWPGVRCKRVRPDPFEGVVGHSIDASSRAGGALARSDVPAPAAGTRLHHAILIDDATGLAYLLFAEMALALRAIP